ncbi:hypothetical protein [Martelella limonii]|uniref:hypothetical protein n=1 Tax=Martelella limonii TaxID=1647649 RepID=UPI0015807168
MRRAAIKRTSGRIGIDLAQGKPGFGYYALIGKDLPDHVAVIAEANPVTYGLIQSLLFDAAAHHSEAAIVICVTVTDRETIICSQRIPYGVPVRADRRQEGSFQNIGLRLLDECLDCIFIQPKRVRLMGHAGNDPAIPVDIIELVKRCEQAVRMSRIASEIPGAQNCSAAQRRRLPRPDLMAFIRRGGQDRVFASIEKPQAATDLQIDPRCKQAHRKPATLCIIIAEPDGDAHHHLRLRPDPHLPRFKQCHLLGEHCLPRKLIRRPILRRLLRQRLEVRALAGKRLRQGAPEAVVWEFDCLGRGGSRQQRQTRRKSEPQHSVVDS